MKTKTGRYSGYIRPFLYSIDLIIVIGFSIFFIGEATSISTYPIFIGCTWLIIAINLGFYEVYRYTKVISILNCSLKQALLFATACFSILFFYEVNYTFKTVFAYIATVLFFILAFKLSIYYLLKKYRVIFGGNSRTVILFGNSKSTAPLQHFFLENPDYGYKLIKIFKVENIKKQQILDCFDFVLKSKIDEMYCSMADFTSIQINEIIHFADNNMKTLKFIPDEKQILSQNYTFDYYNYIPVISLRNIVLDTTFNKVVKRFFDIVFSLIIIICILSWLIPILAIIIKTETKGPLFFVQKRNGLNYKEFNCFKFRSMELNDEAHLNTVSKNDARITKVGKFIRKTSIDELPQFFNVLIGDMSVIGPRPHMVSVTEIYALKVNKFMVRHFVKPGITGLAQTKGFRGEVESDKDIINRVKYDIFYMENWSILLDIKIIFNTIHNILRGDNKAY